MIRRFDKHVLCVGHNAEFLPRLRPRLAGCAVLDPNYNIGLDHGPHLDDDLPPAEYVANITAMLAGVHRSLADDGSAFLFCDRRYLAQLLIAADDVGFHHHDLIVWRYRFGVYQGRRLTNSWCPIAWLTKTRRPYFDADAVRVKSVRQKLGDRRANPLGRIVGNVWLYHRVAGSHAERIAGVRTQLPLKLVRRLVRMSTRPDDVVLDPYAGSGTSVVAAIETGRRGVGVELSPRIAAIAAERIEKTLAAVGQRTI